MEENSLAKTVCDALLSDRKKERRWKNIRFFTWLILFLGIISILISPLRSTGHAIPKHKYVSLVRLNGPIAVGNSFSVRRVIPELTQAFADKHSSGVILLINSPGGSPVQSSIIHDKILQLKKKFKKKVIVVAEDLLASGGYLVACGADKIYVNRDTITGSIGVIRAGFGFVDLIKKIGISRRVFTAGASKDQSDPFKPISNEDKIKIQQDLTEVHDNFIYDVKQGRKGKLELANKKLFSGAIWLGKSATRLGLADGTLDLWQASKKEFGTTRFVDYTQKPSVLDVLYKDVSTELGVSLHNQGGLLTILPSY